MLNSAEHEICPLTNLTLLTIANSFLLNITEQENFSANKYQNANSVCMFISLAEQISFSSEMNMKTVL